MDISVGIIGAGIAGLSCGYELAKRGIEVVILEKNEKVGGRHRTEVYDGYVVDVAAAMFSPAHEPYFFGYFRELGIEDELNVPPTSAKKFALQFGNKFIPLTKASMTFSGLYSFSDLRKMGKFDRYLKKLHFDYNEFDPEQQKNHQISTTDFFQRWGFSDEFTDRFVQPFTAMNYVSPDKMSAATALRLVAHSSAINIRPKNGMSIVAKTIHERLGDNRIITGSEVTGVTQKNGGFSVTYKQGDDVKDISVDVLVCSTPTPITNRLVPQLNIKMDYSVGCTVAVRGKLRPKYRNLLGLLVTRVNNPSNVFSVMMGQEDPGASVVHIYQKPYDLSPYYEEGYEVIEEFYWAPAMVTPRPGAVFPNLETEIENLYICGDFYRNPCCEAATVSGAMVADMIYTRFGDPRKGGVWRM